MRHGHQVDDPEQFPDMLPVEEWRDVMYRELEDVVREPGEGVGDDADHHHDDDLWEGGQHG